MVILENQLNIKQIIEFLVYHQRQLERLLIPILNFLNVNQRPKLTPFQRAKVTPLSRFI